MVGRQRRRVARQSRDSIRPSATSMITSSRAPLPRNHLLVVKQARGPPRPRLLLRQERPCWANGNHTPPAQQATDISAHQHRGLRECDAGNGIRLRPPYICGLNMNRPQTFASREIAA